jgi:hypothetical protein
MQLRQQDYDACREARRRQSDVAHQLQVFLGKMALQMSNWI